MGRSANASVIHDTDEVVICNGGDIFNLHDLRSGSVLRSFKCRKGSNVAARPVQVVCAEKRASIVTGGCNGIISVFDRSTGRLEQELRHSRKGHVQTITVSA